MLLASLQQACLAFGHWPLLDHADFTLESSERVGLIGRNGTGKSSMLKVLSGTQTLDSGECWTAKNARFAYVPQEPDLNPEDSVFDSISRGFGDIGEVLGQYHHILKNLEAHPELSETLGELQARIDTEGAWALDHRIEQTIEKLKLPGDALISALSGGMKKRVALGQALVADPDVLLLDEPTNHLDIDSIDWLEGLLNDYRGGVICITHDRRFLDAITTRIDELDRGVLRSYPGRFSKYLEVKAQQLADEAVTFAKFDKVLAQEEVWIRKGVEARRTRNEGRVRRLEALREQRSARRDRMGKVQLQVDAGDRSGKLVAELEHVSFSYGDRVLIKDFSTRLIRGDKIGLIGPNGAGKSTLLKLILGTLEPTSGKVRRGTNLNVAYFDQMRTALDPDATLVDTINPGAEWVEINGMRKHTMSYLGDFLFAPERARSPVRSLSGGERNRLLLARLFAQPANVLVLDEPTNDLDIETLELLEALLDDYTGTLFLVSHDRTFLDNVVTQSIVFEGDGLLLEYPGGYSEWKAAQSRMAVANPKAEKPTNKPETASKPVVSARASGVKKLSNYERRELDELPTKLETLENQINACSVKLADPATYATGNTLAQQVQQELSKLEALMSELLARWEALESRSGA